MAQNQIAAEQNYLFKILVVGCGGVGKTCCIRKLVYNTFSSEYKATIGVDFSFRVQKVNYKGKEIPVRLQLWDIAGQEKFSNLTRAYYKDAYGCLIVGDLESNELKEDVRIWKNDIDTKVTFPSTVDRIPAVLMLNKLDKPKARENFTDLLKQELQTIGFDYIYGTSAATGEGLEEAVQKLCTLILDKVELVKPLPTANNGPTIPLDEPEPKKSGGCC